MKRIYKCSTYVSLVLLHLFAAEGKYEVPPLTVYWSFLSVLSLSAVRLVVSEAQKLMLI